MTADTYSKGLNSKDRYWSLLFIFIKKYVQVLRSLLYYPGLCFSFPYPSSHPHPITVVKLCTPLLHWLPKHLHRHQFRFTPLPLPHSLSIEYNLNSFHLLEKNQKTCHSVWDHSHLNLHVATHRTVIIQATKRPTFEVSPEKDFLQSLEIICSSVKEIIETLSANKKAEE